MKFRLLIGAGTYRTPIKGLYLCGSSTHPGGNITGLCGFSAASVIVSDPGKDILWDRQEIESVLSSLG